jgi:shikimate dehydrogenase
MNYYGVMGNPIQHSKSPLIHRLFAEQVGISLSYEAIFVELNDFAEALNRFQAKGGKGLNITLPFKHRAFSLVDGIVERALNGEAINTILFHEDGSRSGDNTDGYGLVRDITHNYQFSIENKRVLILGAGGAVSGVIESLLAVNPAMLVVANRTASKAMALVENFISDTPLAACGLQELVGQTFDLIINGTSASLQGDILELPEGMLQQNAFCYDMMYGKGVTPFLQWAQQQAAALWSDGLGMLVEQAAESFYLWHGVRPETKRIIFELKACN